MPKGLLVHVLRPAPPSCTLEGITEQFNMFVLCAGPDKGEDVPEVFEVRSDLPRLELQMYCGALRAVPVDDPRMNDGRHCPPMFGGNFVYASDSRFPNMYPIPVHDRFETGAEANMFSE